MSAINQNHLNELVIEIVSTTPPPSDKTLINNLQNASFEKKNATHMEINFFKDLIKQYSNKLLFGKAVIHLKANIGNLTIAHHDKLFEFALFLDHSNIEFQLFILPLISESFFEKLTSLKNLKKINFEIHKPHVSNPKNSDIFISNQEQLSQIVNFIKKKNTNARRDLDITVSIQDNLIVEDENVFFTTWISKIETIVIKHSSKIGIKKTCPTKNKGICPEPFHKLIIQANGDTVPCEGAFYENKVNIANLHRKNMPETWNNPIYQRLRKLHEKNRRHDLKVCRTCENYTAIQHEKSTLISNNVYEKITTNKSTTIRKSKTNSNSLQYLDLNNWDKIEKKHAIELLRLNTGIKFYSHHQKNVMPNLFRICKLTVQHSECPVVLKGRIFSAETLSLSVTTRELSGHTDITRLRLLGSGEMEFSIDYPLSVSENDKISVVFYFEKNPPETIVLTQLELTYAGYPSTNGSKNLTNNQSNQDKMLAEVS